MRPQLQILDGAGASARTPLPASVTANDVRNVIRYLKKKPGGVTVGEGIVALRKQLFEPVKLDAYEALGITVRSFDRLRLSPLGFEMARRLEPESQMFRASLDNVEAYRAVLKWALDRRLDIVVNADVADYWRAHYPGPLGLNTDRMIDANVTCFFQMCQAAGIGSLIMGKKGQPTRLRVDHEELLSYVAGGPAADAAADPPPVAGPYVTQAARQGAERMRVFVSHRSNPAVAQNIQTALELADVESLVAERKLSEGEPFPFETAEMMRRCDAAIFILAPDECRADGVGPLAAGLQLEVGVAFALYERRIALFSGDGFSPPARFNKLRHYKYDGEDLSWESGIQLLRLIKEFRDAGSHRQ